MERGGRMDGFPNNPKQRLLKKTTDVEFKREKKSIKLQTFVSFVLVVILYTK